ncbi:hypothetical protein [Nocardia arthritidis]|uniref:Uncharacterized protein n=1 Tax=Nocardia arthritidis TaxID=228602 RepID=A0A6G9Y585_9NOCA|nr:hypothetical protein [Nocardia arthritidis]QIS08247.1 hypothetical protein F5544_01625 [Nocardia arthritidis]
MRRLMLSATLVAGLVAAAPAVRAEPSGPAGCVPFGTAQLPPGLPSFGGHEGLADMPVFTGDAPRSVELRTQRTQFNNYWDFALVGDELLTRPRGGAEPWRTVALPECLRGRLTGISMDDDELAAVDDAGWLYTMDNTTQAPLFWNWTSAFGAPLWTGTGKRMPNSAPGTWALSVASPFNNQTYTDVAGRIHYSGWAKMTMVPALTGDGSRITYADPWLPDDNSYEIGGPLGGRFRAVALSAAGSTTFVMNRYGDMYTRNFDFDSSGSDSVFFRYSWDDQSDKPTAPNAALELLSPSYAAIQLPAPDWVRQPKIPGTVTAAISVHSTGIGPDKRELRVAGSSAGRTGFWHKNLDDPAWAFTPTDAPLDGSAIDNTPEDRSADTLAAPAPWNLTASLPVRDTPIDGQRLIDSVVPYSIIDPRIFDRVDPARPSGYRLAVAHFDPAATTRAATVLAPDGARIPVLLHTADGLRATPRAPGLDAEPRHLVGALEIDRATFDSRDADPAVAEFVRNWMNGKRIMPLSLSATDRDLIVR